MGMPTADLIPEFLKATEAAAIAVQASPTAGQAAIRGNPTKFDEIPKQSTISMLLACPGCSWGAPGGLLCYTPCWALCHMLLKPRKSDGVL